MIETEDTPIYGEKNKKKKLNVGSTWWPWNYSTWGLARQTDCHAGAELELFVRGDIINIIKYNIYFTLLYMSYKKNLYNLVLFK